MHPLTYSEKSTVTAARILHGLKSGLTRGLTNGLGLASCIYVAVRDYTFTHMMSGLDSCSMRFPFGYSCNNLTYWNPDFHTYSQASLDTWEETSGYLITLVGSIVLIDTAITAYYYSTQVEPEEKTVTTPFKAVLAEGAKSFVYGSVDAYFTFALYRESLPFYNNIGRKIDLHYFPQEDSFCFRMFNEEACDTFNTYTWILISSYVIHGSVHQFIKSHWNEFTDWTRHALTEAANGFRSGWKWGALYAFFTFSPTRDLIYSEKASELGHTWPSKFPRFGFDCTPSPEFNDNLHGLSVGEGMKVLILYSGPATLLLTGALNAGYKFFEAQYTYAGRTAASEIIPSQYQMDASERKVETLDSKDLENPLLESNPTNTHSRPSHVKTILDLGQVAVMAYASNYLRTH